MLENQILPIVSVSMALSALAYILTPNLAGKLKKMRIVGRDLHKRSHPEVAEMGGILIFFPALAFLASAYMLSGGINIVFVAASTAFFGVYGLVDDVKQLGQYRKLALSSAIGLLLLVPAGVPVLMIPVFLLITIALGNVFNLFAGFNGLEIGCSAITAFFLSLMCLVTGRMEPFYISLGFSAILASFLLHNKFPARIFPGNIGTFTVGGFFAGICLYYGLYLLILPLLALHIADSALKIASAGYFNSKDKKPTKVNGKNILVPTGDYMSMSRLVLRKRPMTEKGLVRFFWGLNILIGTISVIGAGVVL